MLIKYWIKHAILLEFADWTVLRKQSRNKQIEMFRYKRMNWIDSYLIGSSQILEEASIRTKTMKNMMPPWAIDNSKNAENSSVVFGKKKHFSGKQVFFHNGVTVWPLLPPYLSVYETSNNIHTIFTFNLIDQLIQFVDTFTVRNSLIENFLYSFRKLPCTMFENRSRKAHLIETFEYSS